MKCFQQTDIFFTIFSFLKLCDLVAFMIASKACHIAADTNPYVWEFFSKAYCLKCSEMFRECELNGVNSWKKFSFQLEACKNLRRQWNLKFAFHCYLKRVGTPTMQLLSSNNISTRALLETNMMDVISLFDSFVQHQIPVLFSGKRAVRHWHWEPMLRKEKILPDTVNEYPGSVLRVTDWADVFSDQATDTCVRSSSLLTISQTSDSTSRSTFRWVSHSHPYSFYHYTSTIHNQSLETSSTQAISSYWHKNLEDLYVSVSGDPSFALHIPVHLCRAHFMYEMGRKEILLACAFTAGSFPPTIHATVSAIATKIH